MIELGKSAREFAQKLPHGHPEKAALEGMAAIAESWSMRNGKLSAEFLPEPEQLVTQEKVAWQRFLGREIKVPSPPQELYDVWSRAKEEGIGSFEAHYLPKITLKQNSKAPGWQTRPEKWFWKQIKDDRVAKDAAKLEDVWVLIDGTQKPAYDRGYQEYQGDFLEERLDQLRRMDKIRVPNYYKDIPATSRFAVSWDEINDSVLEEVAQILQVNRKQVRLPRAIEFNVIGNLHHLEWGATNTWEWFDDKFEDDGRLIGGSSGSGGLSYVDCDWRYYRGDRVGFRPLVVFSSK